MEHRRANGLSIFLSHTGTAEDGEENEERNRVEGVRPTRHVQLATPDRREKKWLGSLFGRQNKRALRASTEKFYSKKNLRRLAVGSREGTKGRELQ